jgi:type II secretory pathway predicted ATPase ExeA
MDKSSNLKLLSAIKKQLDSLEDSFYDGIPNELLKNAHITHFSHMMEAIHTKIITLVKNSIQDVDVNKIDDWQNLNYSQLEALSKKEEHSKKDNLEG